MKIALETEGGVNRVTAYTPGEVRIRDRVYQRSLIVSAGRIVSDWPVADVGALCAAHFRPVTEDPPEVLLLGTGETQVFPEPSVFVLMMDRGIGFEVMANAAACRTYNILLAEDRRVALALILGAKT